MDPIVVRKDEARTFYEGPELCREYHVTEKITFGSSTLQPGETGDIDLGHPASHGCIRVSLFAQEDCPITSYWLWTHLPYHTRVIVLDD